MPTVSPIITTRVATPQPIQPTSIEAKLVILGAQGVGKTSLVSRFVNPSTPLSPNIQSTIGASFITKKISDPDSLTTVRLQIWDTAGQERFRSISRLYYRGAHVGLLCYDVTDEKSWEEMNGWLKEMKENCDFSGDNAPIIHIVGTKSDIVAEDPSRRQVAFERTIAYVAEQLGGVTNLSNSQASTPPLTLASKAGTILTTTTVLPSTTAINTLQSPESKRSSVGFWNQDFGWDSCHEVNSKDGEGIEEVFRVIARKLIEQRNRREAAEAARAMQTPGYRSDYGGSGDDYFTNQHGHNGSFRLGDKRRSWLGLPSVGLGVSGGAVDGDASIGAYATLDPKEARRRGGCC